MEVEKTSLTVNWLNGPSLYACTLCTTGLAGIVLDIHPFDKFHLPSHSATTTLPNIIKLNTHRLSIIQEPILLRCQLLKWLLQLSREFVDLVDRGGQVPLLR